MNEESFYNYNNLESYYKKIGIAQPSDYLRWTKDIINTAVEMFDYEGQMPEGLNTRIIETALMFNNLLCFYKSPELGVVLCRYRFSSEFSLYWEPIKVDLLALNGKPIAFGVPWEDIIPFRDNTMDIIPFLTLNSYVDKIIEQEKTLAVLTKLVRLPAIFTGTKEQTAMLKQVIKKNLDCEPFIVAEKDFKQHMEQFDVNMPCKLIEVYELLEKYKNMATGSMGIYSVDEKRERVVTAEINATNDFVDFIYTGKVECRKQALEEARRRGWFDLRLVERYELNRKDEIELTREETKAIEEEKAKAQNLIEDKGGFPNA